MKFGIFDQNDASGRPLHVQYEQRLELAEMYDQNGFHCYHLSEHHATPLSMGPSQSVFLSAVAQRTRNLKLCPLVYLLPIHHPVRLAEEICMLDQLSNGRFEFGVGRGVNPHELEALGFTRATAGGAYAEAYEILMKYFSSDVLNYPGQFWNIQNLPVTLKPYQTPHPPVWYAVATADSAVWPAQNSVNIICGGPEIKVREISDRYRQEASQGKTADQVDPLIGVWRYVVVADTDKAAMEIAEKAWPSFYDSFYKLWRMHGTEPERMKLSPHYAGMVASGHAVAGSPETVAHALTQKARAGNLNYLVSQFMFGNMPHEHAKRSVDLFSREVIPAVQAASKDWL